MDIYWYGQSCFRLRGRGVAVVMDPYCPDIGLTLPRLVADLVTVSHDHADHCHVKGVRRGAYVVTGPGEYEVGGVFVIGVPTFHDARNGKDRGRNTAYVVEMEELTVCHLGDLGHVPTQEQVEQFDGVDVLMVPVGGRTVLTATKAAEVVAMLEPAIVIPMHYRIPGLEPQMDGVARFLREMAVDEPEPIEFLRITKSQLPTETRVVLLDAKQ